MTPTTFKKGEDLAVQKKQESKLESSLGPRGMSKDQMMGKSELKSMLSGMKGTIGGAVRGFLGRLFGKK